MGNVLVVVLLALPVNLWANDGSVGDGNWPQWAVRRVIPLICTAAIVLVLTLWSRERVARRLAVRVSVVILLAALLNIVPFIFEDVKEYVNGSPAQLQTHVVQAEPSSAPSRVFDLFNLSDYRSRVAQEKQQAQYAAALNACMEERSREHPDQSDNAVRFVCVSNASHSGPAAFIARYANPNKPSVRANNIRRSN